MKRAEEHNTELLKLLNTKMGPKIDSWEQITNSMVIGLYEKYEQETATKGEALRRALPWVVVPVRVNPEDFDPYYEPVLPEAPQSPKGKDVADASAGRVQDSGPALSQAPKSPRPRGRERVDMSTGRVQDRFDKVFGGGLHAR